jgi:hypothetical protein
MGIQTRVADRLRGLIERGEEVLATRKDPGRNMIGFDSWVDSELANQWFTSSQNLLQRAFGPTSSHYTNFSEIPGKQGLSFSPVRRGQGILRAALEDLEDGYLFDVRRLIEAEVFSDFLDQAEELLRTGYSGPAAVVAGCVLEDGLRRLCVANGIALPERPALDRMNADLARTGAYSKLALKRITAIADIRNNAAHGNWDEFDKDDVKDMIEWITKFTQEQFG